MTAKKTEMKKATRMNAFDGAGYRKYKCPYCRRIASVDDYDVLGADEDCLFCNGCQREVKAPD